MKPTDRYIVEIPGIIIKKLSVSAQGVPHIEHFSEIGGASYDGVTYEMVVGLEQVYASVAAELAKLGAQSISAPPQTG